MKKIKLVNLYKSLNDKPLHEQEEPTADQEAPTADSKFNEEKVEIEIPGVEGKTEVKIKYPAEDDDRALQGVTIEFNGEIYSDIEFEADDMIEDHENEGQVWVFIAEGDGITFELDVDVEASYQESGNIQAIHWESLTVTYDDEGEPLDERRGRSDKKPHYWGSERPDDDEYTSWGCDTVNMSCDPDADCGICNTVSPFFNCTLCNDTCQNYCNNFLNENNCTDQEIREGTCGYALDGEVDIHNTDRHEPAGSHLFYLDEELKGCKEDKDCASEGLCCIDSECQQCITFDKPKGSKLDESIVNRLKKLAGINPVKK